MGQDPQAEKSRQRTTLAIGGLIDTFYSQHVQKKCKPGTAYGYKIALHRLRDSHGSLKADALTRAHVAAMHTGLADTPYAANRFLSAVSKCFSWAVDRGLLPENHTNPAGRIERYREQGHDRFLTSEELARLGDALREGETKGLPYEVDESKLTAAKSISSGAFSFCPSPRREGSRSISQPRRWLSWRACRGSKQPVYHSGAEAGRAKGRS